MRLAEWWRARRARARRINDELAARDGRSRLDEADFTRKKLDRLWEQVRDDDGDGR